MSKGCIVPLYQAAEKRLERIRVHSDMIGEAVVRLADKDCPLLLIQIKELKHLARWLKEDCELAEKEIQT